MPRAAHAITRPRTRSLRRAIHTRTFKAIVTSSSSNLRKESQKVGGLFTPVRVISACSTNLGAWANPDLKVNLVAPALLFSASSTSHQSSTSLSHVRDSSRRRPLGFHCSHRHHSRPSSATLLPATRHSELRTRRKILRLHPHRFTSRPTSSPWLMRRLPQLQ